MTTSAQPCRWKRARMSAKSLTLRLRRSSFETISPCGLSARVASGRLARCLVRRPGIARNLWLSETQVASLGSRKAPLNDDRVEIARVIAALGRPQSSARECATAGGGNDALTGDAGSGGNQHAAGKKNASAAAPRLPHRLSKCIERLIEARPLRDGFLLVG